MNKKWKKYIKSMVNLVKPNLKYFDNKTENSLFKEDSFQRQWKLKNKVLDVISFVDLKKLYNDGKSDDDIIDLIEKKIEPSIKKGEKYYLEFFENKIILKKKEKNGKLKCLTICGWSNFKGLSNYSDEIHINEESIKYTRHDCSKEKLLISYTIPITKKEFNRIAKHIESNPFYEGRSYMVHTDYIGPHSSNSTFVTFEGNNPGSYHITDTCRDIELGRILKRIINKYFKMYMIPNLINDNPPKDKDNDDCYFPLFFNDNSKGKNN